VAPNTPAHTPEAAYSGASEVRSVPTPCVTYIQGQRSPASLGTDLLGESRGESTGFVASWLSASPHPSLSTSTLHCHAGAVCPFSCHAPFPTRRSRAGLQRYHLHVSLSPGGVLCHRYALALPDCSPSHALNGFSFGDSYTANGYKPSLGYSPVTGQTSITTSGGLSESLCPDLASEGHFLAYEVREGCDWLL